MLGDVSVFDISPECLAKPPVTHSPPFTADSVSDSDKYGSYLTFKVGQNMGYCVLITQELPDILIHTYMSSGRRQYRVKEVV